MIIKRKDRLRAERSVAGSECSIAAASLPQTEVAGLTGFDNPLHLRTPLLSLTPHNNSAWQTSRSGVAWSSYLAQTHLSTAFAEVAPLSVPFASLPLRVHPGSIGSEVSGRHTQPHQTTIASLPRVKAILGESQSDSRNLTCTPISSSFRPRSAPLCTAVSCSQQAAHPFRQRPHDACRSAIALKVSRDHF